MHRNRLIAIVLAALLFLGGCAEAEAGAPERVSEGTPLQSAGIQGSSSAPAGSEPVKTETPSASAEPDFVPYQAPEFAGASFHADMAEGDENVQIDMSAVNLGYVAVSAKGDARLKFQVLKDGYEYSYNIASDGTPSVFPLQCGDGTYTFRVMKNVTGGKYGYYYVTTKEVVLEDEFQPFLRPSDFVNYDEDSDCVKKAAELAAGEKDALGVVTAVFEYVRDNIDYDREKAARVKNDKTYLPDPDEILDLGKGICFDYAALTAAMLRSQGIPVKMVFGLVSSGNQDVYHAWNLIYTEETGWIALEYSVEADAWNRLDVTFSAGGADSSFIGDGGNYVDQKYY